MEREIALRLKGDNTLMQKRQQSMQRDIDSHKEDIKQMYENEKELRKHIALNEKDIRGQRQEIKERDETIGDKEKRIFDLKRKNQELEKFKFVLDYKIKELKKQIEPKMEQIAAMKEQINKMDQELERYHKNNANLELSISDLKLKLGGVQRELKAQRNRAKDAEAYITRFKTEVHDVVQAIQDPHALKSGTKALYHKYCARGDGEAELGSNEEDAGVASEYARQRDYLEKTVNSLKRKLSKDTERHRVESMRIMQENVALIKEINELRREMKAMKAQVAPACRIRRRRRRRRCRVVPCRGRRLSRLAKIDSRVVAALRRPRRSVWRAHRWAAASRGGGRHTPRRYDKQPPHPPH
jgi:ribosomal protein S15P/S13E